MPPTIGYCNTERPKQQQTNIRQTNKFLYCNRNVYCENSDELKRRNRRKILK